MNNYYNGDLPALAAVFTDATGTATDPTTVTVTVIAPDGTTATPVATKDSTGHYHVDYDLTGAQSGVYRYEFAGTGACQAVMVNEFFVEPSAF